MKKYLLIIPLFLFSCKKDTESPRALLNVQASNITFYNVDIGTGTETFQYDIRYYYNTSTERYDSIGVGVNSFIFDYDQVDSSLVLFNWVNSSLPYDAIRLDPNFNTVRDYTEIRPSPDYWRTSRFEYVDSTKRLSKYTYDYPGSEHFERTYTFHYDTTFIHADENSGSCTSTDTLINSVYTLGTSMPWLTFIEPAAHCGSMGYNILRALSVSGYANPLPARILNGDAEVDYTYFGDTYSRLSQVDIVFKSRSTGAITSKLRIKISY